MHSVVNIEERKSVTRDQDLSLARALVEREVLTRRDAKGILEELKQRKDNVTFEDSLLEKELVEREIILETKAALFNVPYIDLVNYEIDPEVIELIPGNVARQYQIFPLFRIDSTLLVTMVDPKNVEAIDKLTRLTQLDISPALSSREAIEETITRYYGESQNKKLNVSNEELKDILEVMEAESESVSEEANTQDLERLAEEAPVVKMTNMVLTQAIVDGASDVHLNPEETQLRVRFRVDGVLREALTLPKHQQEAIISRIKILSSLDIAEKRVPQDGQLRLKLSDGRDIDIRVSTLPSAYGENVVMRILDKSAALLKLENLGFEEDIREKLYEILNSAYGIMLVTGPTGSGKTTTLYASLNYLNTIEKNIITLEDPIEYRLPLIRQSQVNHKAGMTFAKGLKAILRQDPDIVMVGEIRDSETGGIAVQASLTGHLVLSTLHTNDAAGAITRLSEMGVEPFLVSSSVLGVLAQRLVRKICPECKEEVQPEFKVPKAVLESLGMLGREHEIKFYKGRGCKACRETGYKGRVGIIEILTVSERVREAILLRKSTDEIKAIARQEGMRTLVEDGWLKVFRGMTTFDEVMRVTNVH